ncbi:MAG: hypothetical protein ACYTEX_21930 [Planctomycetota bacterium]|jgi:hypothetical protein
MAKRASRAKPKRASKKPPTEGQELAVLQSGKINFDYIKSNQFRVIRVDGAHGGIAPNGRTIQMALFSERSPIPKRETYKLEKGRLGAVATRDARDAVIREVEVEALMDLETANRIVAWLKDKIDVAEKLRKQLGEL